MKSEQRMVVIDGRKGVMGGRRPLDGKSRGQRSAC